jgi:HEAT repeat protein
VIVAAGGRGNAAPLSNAEPVLKDLAARAQDRNLPEAERLQLAKALAGWATPQVLDALLVLLEDSVPSIRETAALGLGWEGNREAVAALRKRLADSAEVPAVKAAAVASLGKIGDPSARPAVLTAVENPDARVRSMALGVLTDGPLASPDDRIGLLRRLAGDQALDLLKRCEAIQELGKAKDLMAVPMLMRLLEQEPPVPMPLPPGDSAGDHGHQVSGVAKRPRVGRQRPGCPGSEGGTSAAAEIGRRPR